MKNARGAALWAACLVVGVGLGATILRTLHAEPLPECEWCGAADAPPLSELSWSAVIAPADEPGERLIVSGVVYEPDGRTPASGVMIYAYHTDATGMYPKRGDEAGNARRHGRLRAWMLTGEDGRYRFETIKPASYPDSTISAHIHATVSREGQSERWIDDFLFAGDPFVTEREADASAAKGRFGHVLRLEQGEDGALRAERDILWPTRETR